MLSSCEVSPYHVCHLDIDRAYLTQDNWILGFVWHLVVYVARILKLSKYSLER
jgi:hypothetical protein